MADKRKNKYTGHDWVYFIQRADGDIKIGCTMNLTLRMSQLRKKYGNFEILGLTPGHEYKEALLHKQFAAHVRMTPQFKGGVRPSEWFAPVPELLAYIAQHTEPYSNPIARKFNRQQAQPTADAAAAKAVRS